MQASTPREKLLTLEAGRGVAAFLVLMVHIHKYYFATPDYWSGPFLGGFFAFGDMGVHYFFVLSGFVMMWAHWNDFGQPRKVGRFVARRFIRIYPLVWLTVSVMAVLFLLFPSSNGFPDDPSLLPQSLLLVGVNPHAAINFPTWTLWHENVFYLFCAAIIAAPRIGLALFAGWMVVCATQFDFSATEDAWYVINPLNCLFGLGVAAAFLLRHGTCPAPRLVLVAGLVVFLGSGVANNVLDLHPQLRQIISGISAMAIVVGGVEAERSGRLAMPPFARFLGILSFPLYLTHMIVLPILGKTAVMTGATRWIPELVAGLGMAVACICAALLTHYLYEKPVTRWLSARMRAAQRQPAVA